jgi:hypothetical protein
LANKTFLKNNASIFLLDCDQVLQVWLYLIGQRTGAAPIPYPALRISIVDNTTGEAPFNRKLDAQQGGRGDARHRLA